MNVTITDAGVIQFAAVITAVGIIAGAVFSIGKRFFQSERNSKEIELLKKEQAVICRSLLACLDGLKQLGANGNVTKAHDELEKHLNKTAHGG